jgi:hypothetical protein
VLVPVLQLISPVCKTVHKQVHTFTGMLGYCTKNSNEPHFREVRKNVSADLVARGKDIYVLLGSAGTEYSKTSVQIDVDETSIVCLLIFESILIICLYILFYRSLSTYSCCFLRFSFAYASSKFRRAFRLFSRLYRSEEAGGAYAPQRFHQGLHALTPPHGRGAAGCPVQGCFAVNDEHGEVLPERAVGGREETSVAAARRFPVGSHY